MAASRAESPLREVYEVLSLFLFRAGGCRMLSNGILYAVHTFVRHDFPHSFHGEKPPRLRMLLSRGIARQDRNGEKQRQKRDGLYD